MGTAVAQMPSTSRRPSESPRRTSVIITTVITLAKKSLWDEWIPGGTCWTGSQLCVSVLTDHTHHLWSYTFRMDLSALVTPVARQTLSRDIYQQLRELLMSGHVMPGELLSLRSIAESLGVSVMPVREAVNRLLSEKALELLPNRGLRVPTMTVSQFREITAIRVNLEGMATARAAELVDEKGLREIEAAHERFTRESLLKRPNEANLIALNKELHFAIYRQARMPILLEMIEALWLRIGPILNYDFRSGSARVTNHVSVAHHDRIFAALKKKDPAGASKALAGDLQGAADFIVGEGKLVADAQAPSPAPSVRRAPAAAPAKGAKRSRASAVN
jgi:DNA-binding GntR family transcriptional regulator